MAPRLKCEKIIKDYMTTQGWQVARSTYYIPFSNRSKDMWEFSDLVAVDCTGVSTGTLYIQATSIGNMSARYKKMQDNPYIKNVLNAGNMVWIIGTERAKMPRKGCEYDGKHLYKFREITMADLT